MKEQVIIKQKNGNRILLIMLGGLGVLILLLGVSIFLLNSRERESQNVNDEGMSYEEINVRVEALSKIHSDLSSMFEPEALEYLDGQIMAYQNTDLLHSVELIKVNYLNNAGKTNEALELLDSLMDKLNASERLDALLAYRNIYGQMNDATKYQEYQDLYMEEYLKYYDGGAGIE